MEEERETTKMRRKEREKGKKNVTEVKYKAKVTRDRRRWGSTTAVWRMENITKMREKAGDKTCRPQTGTAECLGHHQPAPELVHMVWKLLLHS